MKKFLVLFILINLVTSCGYKNINFQSGNELNVQEITLTGNKKIGHILENEILIISSKEGERKISIDLFINKEKSIKTKNTSGKVTKYEIVITADLIITELKSEKTTKKNFTKSGSFDVKAKHVDTINTEKRETRNITNQISEDISNYFKINYIN